MVKIIAIASKDLLSSFRSLTGLVTMIAIPLLITGMFYFMFGRIANEGDFNLAATRLAIANLDEGGPRFNVSTDNVPDGSKADSMGELIVSIAQSDELDNLLDVDLFPEADSARKSVDSQVSQVAIVIPPDFSRQFADVYGQSEIEFYQDPTLTIGPGIVRSIINQFLDGMSSVKIAISIAVDELGDTDPGLINPVIERYLQVSEPRMEDPEKLLLEVRPPQSDASSTPMGSPLLALVAPVMGGMLIFYAFNTGASTAQSILHEEERRTLPRLFTTPTSQATILSGKFLSVFVTVLAQVCVLLIAAHLLFGIHWGPPASIAVASFGIVMAAASFGIFVNSFRQSTRHGGVIFGGLLTLTNMLGMISMFVINSPAGERMSTTVSLLVPQGWGARVMLLSLRGQPPDKIIPTAFVLMLWSAVFFIAGVWRFNHRYR